MQTSARRRNFGDCTVEFGVIRSDDAASVRSTYPEEAMRPDDQHGLSPVIVALRVGLQLLFVALLGFVMVMALLAPTPSSPAVLAVGALMGLTWLTGAVLRSIRSITVSRRVRFVWIAVLLAQWATLVWLSPHAAYLVFPLCFLILEAMAPVVGIVIVVIATGAVVVAIGLHTGWSFGGVIGPIVAAIVAVGLSAGYRALAAEAREHERLYIELQATQSQLVATQRHAGAAAERERLAREIHDTVAQNLSSITLLLHAAERADPTSAGIDHLRLARRSATDALADARRLIRDLAPAHLESRGLAAALRDLGEQTSTAGGIEVYVVIADRPGLPMEHQAALLRIAQGTLGNVVAHAGATAATLDVVVDASSVHMTVRDDGQGFTPGTPPLNPEHGSFGLRSVRERVEQLGGSVQIESTAGVGTRVSVTLPLPVPLPSGTPA